MEKRPNKPGSWTFRLLLIAIVLAAIVGWAASVSPGGPDDVDWAAAIVPAVILILMAMRFAASGQPLGRMARICPSLWRSVPFWSWAIPIGAILDRFPDG